MSKKLHRSRQENQMSEETLKDDLSNYNPDRYEKPSVTVDIIICSIKDGRLKVLLIKRKHPPFRDHWAIPGGFVEIEKKETLEETAARELKEETNVENIYIEQLKTYGDPFRDPRMRIITVAYYALIPYNGQFKNLQAGDDAKEAEWFPLDEPPKNLSFDHAQILQDCLTRLRGKILYAPLAFELVPKKFTWSELQSVYEIVLGHKLFPSNFRRKIRAMYKTTVLKTKKKEGFGRPRILLTYRGMKKTL